MIWSNVTNRILLHVDIVSNKTSLNFFSSWILLKYHPIDVSQQPINQSLLIEACWNICQE